MEEILRGLPAGARVLDLGCDEGSFPAEGTKAITVRVDRDVPKRRDGEFVQGDAGRLPFSDGSFAAVISNHSLEHFEALDVVLAEIGRVVGQGGALFVAVPDASTLTDRIYRWLGRGGGHVNRFTSAEDVARKIECGTGLRHVATKTLWSSLSFLNRSGAPRPLPRRLWLVGGGFEAVLRGYVRLSRHVDRWFGTRTGVYGWAFYFGEGYGPVDTTEWVNVCVRCGSGFPESLLKGRGTYRCPNCGTLNPLISA
jgi:SAM-dependent methyltransferase